MMLIRLVTAYNVWHYDISLAPGEDGASIVKNAKNYMVVRPGSLHLVFDKRV
jgi:hypothetical protein